MNTLEFVKECREMIKTPLEMKLERACKIIDDQVPVCPSCGDSDLSVFVDIETFGGPEIFIPVHCCNKCSFKWTDDIGGQVWDKNRALLAKGAR